MRCDRVDFRPGGIAYRHTHPGPGIRYLLFGSITIDSEGAAATYGPGEPWFERGPDPVLATTAADEPSAFVRVMLLPVAWEGQRTIRYVDPADAEKPKTQKATIFLEQRAWSGDPQRRPGPRRPARPARHGHRVRRARRELPRGARRAPRRAAAADRHPPRGRRGEHGRGLRQADRPPGRLPGHARARGDARGHRRAHGVPGLDADAAAVGQVARDTVGREGFQELDYRAMFGPIAKWATQVDDAGALPEIMARAFAVALGAPRTGRHRAAEDMLTDEVDVPDARPHRPVARRARARRARAPGRPARRGGAAAGVVGEGGWTAQTGADVAAFAEAAALPVAASFRCQDYVDNASPATPGHAGLGMDPALARRIREADVLLAIGGRLGEIPTNGYTLVASARPTQRLVHVHPDADELGAVYQPELPIVVGPERFAAAARDAGAGGRRAPRRACSRRRARSTSATCTSTRELPGALQLAAVMAMLRERLRPDAIVTNGAGNFTSGRTASTSSTATRPSSRRAAARWATASRRPWPPRRCTPSARSSASPATATS